MNQLISILLLSIICAFAGFAFNKMQDVDMIFMWYKNTLRKIGHKSQLLHYVVKPLGLCVICNTTWIGFITTFVLNPHQKYLLFNMLAVGMCSAGMVILIINYFNHLQIINEDEKRKRT
jgi:hypothetical protein